LEAAVLGCPVLNIIPKGAPALLEGAFLSHRINRIAVGVDEAVAIAGRVLDGDGGILEQGADARRAVSREYFVGLDGAFAHENFAATVDDFMAAHGVEKSNFQWAPTNSERLLTRLNDADYHGRKISLSLGGFRAA
jgi:hypothetical protein